MPQKNTTKGTPKPKRGGARKGAGRPKTGKPTRQKTTVTLYEETKEIMKSLGNGNLSDGINIGAKIYQEMTTDRFFTRMPVSEQCRLLLEIAQENPDLLKSEECQNRIADTLDKIESLGIETAYEDAEIEGIIEPKGGCYIA